MEKMTLAEYNKKLDLLYSELSESVAKVEWLKHQIFRVKDTYVSQFEESVCENT